MRFNDSRIVRFACRLLLVCSFIAFSGLSPAAEARALLDVSNRFLDGRVKPGDARLRQVATTIDSFKHEKSTSWRGPDYVAVRHRLAELIAAYQAK